MISPLRFALSLLQQEKSLKRNNLIIKILNAPRLILRLINQEMVDESALSVLQELLVRPGFEPSAKIRPRGIAQENAGEKGR